MHASFAFPLLCVYLLPPLLEFPPPLLLLPLLLLLLPLLLLPLLLVVALPLLRGHAYILLEWTHTRFASA